MKTNFLLFAFVGASLLSCNKTDNKATYLENDAATQTADIDVVNNAKNNATQNLLSGSTITNNTNPQVISGPAPAGTAVNPPHGQPGHRCEIAVGTPINSSTSVAPPQKISTNTTPQSVQNPTPAQKTVTAPGMNPPHGEPGHKCEIAVGAPLNSAPASAAPVTTTSLTPAVQTSAPIASTTAPGMNPPHGEPGHKCEIAVGAPLK